jgi:hypothetical protein
MRSITSRPWPSARVSRSPTPEIGDPHYQARFDKLEALAQAGDWDGVRGCEVKGINSYAKMVKQYRDRLLAAHAAPRSGGKGGRLRVTP